MFLVNTLLIAAIVCVTAFNGYQALLMNRTLSRVPSKDRRS